MKTLIPSFPLMKGLGALLFIIAGLAFPAELQASHYNYEELSCTTIPNHEDEFVSWTLIHVESNIQVYASVLSCNGKSYYALRIENSSSQSQDVLITMSIPFEYAYGPQKYTGTIPPKGSLEANCSNENLKATKLLEGQNQDLTSISINLQIL